MSSYIGANAQGIIASIDGGTISNATLASSVTFPANDILQCKFTTNGTTQSSSDSTSYKRIFETSGVSDSIQITTRNQSSNILVLANIAGCYTSGLTQRLQFKILCSTTDSAASSSWTNAINDALYNNSQNIRLPMSFARYFSVSPNTTYYVNVAFRNVEATGGTVYINQGTSNFSTLTAFEVAS